MGSPARGHPDTIARLKSLEALEASIPSNGRQHWQIVQNAVFSQLFAWPLLVAKGRELEPEATSHSIPVLVDVRFDDQGRTILIGSGKDDDALIDAAGWRAELDRAAAVARALWRAKHGSVSLRFRDQVMSCSVIFDFRLAAKLVQTAGCQMRLSESSMGPYFSQVVLHRLLGRQPGLDLLITGKIGPQRRRQDGAFLLDFEFEPVGCIDAKLAYAFRAKTFSRVILPFTLGEEDKKLAYAYASQDTVAAEVVYCHALSNVADAAQTSGWRQFHYIRAPDIQRAFQGGDPPAAVTPAEIARVAEALQVNRSPVLHLDASYRVDALIAHLRRVNGPLREEMSPIPPSLAWTFIRAVEDENDRRFWATVWWTFGSDREEFLRVRHATTPLVVAKYLASALNRFSPTETSLSHRAPDLLIITDAKRLAPSAWKNDAHSYRSHIAPAVLAAFVNETVYPITSVTLRPLFGATRVIVMDAGDADVDSQLMLKVPLVRNGTALRRLAVFRFGFTQQMAGVVLETLGLSGIEVRHLLNDFRAEGVLNYVAGHYWVPGAVRGTLLEDISEADLAERHWAAAKAFAPFLSNSAAPGLGLPALFLPQNVHEVTYHLECAGDLFTRAAFAVRRSSGDWARIDLLRQAVRVAHGRWLQFFELPSPGVVQDLAGERQGLSSNAAWEMAQRLLDEKDQLGITPAPQELAIYANAGLSWLEANKDKAQELSRWPAMILEVGQLFERAAQASAKNEGDDEEVYLARKLAVLTHFAHFADRFNVEYDPMQSNIDRLRRQIMELIDLGIRSAAVQARWFEAEGDRIESDVVAAQQYHVGIQMSPKWRSFWVKFAGSSSIEQLSQAIDESLLPTGTALSVMRAWALNQKVPDGPIAGRRWKRGLENLARFS